MDSLAQRFDAPLPEERHGQLNTFAVFNRRRKVTSSAKRRREPGSTRVAQTPDGSFLDLMRNAEELLARCGMRTPQARVGRSCHDPGGLGQACGVWGKGVG